MSIKQTEATLDACHCRGAHCRTVRARACCHLQSLSFPSPSPGFAQTFSSLPSWGEWAAQILCVHWRRAGEEAGREAAVPAGSSKQGSQPCLPCLGVLSPSPATAGFGPSTLPASMPWQASPSSSFHFSSLVSIVFLFGELESMIELEMWLASASDTTGWVFSFQIGLSLSTSSPGQLEGCTALLWPTQSGSDAALTVFTAERPFHSVSGELQSAGLG